MTAQLDDIMNRASESLAKMDYLECEALCLQALASARHAKDWAYYGRILMPLQECRRQRRMIAAEGTVRLGTASLTGDPIAWLKELEAGCVVVTFPHNGSIAKALSDAARQERRCVEVLYAENPTDEDPWKITTFSGALARCTRKPPPAHWFNRWLPHDEPAIGALTPADWFLDASEALGDAALRAIPFDEGDIRRIQALEQCLDAVADHEILHQQLGSAVRAVQRAPNAT